MNAIEFLTSRGRAVPLHPVTVHLIDPQDPGRVADASAVLRFVPERLRLAAEDAAAESLAKSKTVPTPDRRASEEAYHFLVQAVRQESSPSVLFFDTVEQAKSMLVDSEALRLRNEYERYKTTHFPATLTDEEAQRIAEDARNFTVADLLRSYGYWRTLSALPFLAVTFGASLTSTSSPTGSATTSPAP